MVYDRIPPEAVVHIGNFERLLLIEAADWTSLSGQSVLRPNFGRHYARAERPKADVN